MLVFRRFGENLGGARGGCRTLTTVLRLMPTATAVKAKAFLEATCFLLGEELTILAELVGVRLGGGRAGCGRGCGGGGGSGSGSGRVTLWAPQTADE